ncbi:MAG: endonuclease III [Deltaproteobacteria bacterium]|nr:endonuclease III [Deltaproteobacteria bacterium]
MRESPVARRKRAGAIARRLRKAYPGAGCTLDFVDPLQLLVATILSAQCTDERVNEVTKTLFRKYRKAEDFVRAPPDELEEDIRSTGFYRQKARAIRELSRDLLHEHGGKVPRALEDLVKLRGVGRKTANVVRAAVWGEAGIIVDTHVKRLSGPRLALTRETDPVKIEFDLQKLLPEKDWSLFSQALILHGRHCCKARKPECPGCALADLCPFSPKTRP